MSIRAGRTLRSRIVMPLASLAVAVSLVIAAGAASARAMSQPPDWPFPTASQTVAPTASSTPDDPSPTSPPASRTRKPHHTPTPTADPTGTPDPTGSGDPGQTPTDDPTPSDQPSGSSSPTPAPTETEPTPAPTPAPRPVTVTLDFDDNTVDQLAASNLLQSLGMRAVFYVNSGRLDAGGDYMSTAQVHGLQDSGHEIGGHTVSHVRLSELDPVEQQRQICADRSRLLAAGLTVSSFGSPFADLDAPAQAAAQACGYNNARTVGGLSCLGCDAAETVPPASLYRTRSVSGLHSDTTAAQLTVAVQRAQATGGWLQFVFQRICATTPCAGDGIRLGEFETFVRWLDEQRRDAGLTIDTVRGVLGGTLQPAVAPPPATATRLQIINASFENAGSTPDSAQCFTSGTNGDSNVFTSRRVSDHHTGAWSQEVVVTQVTGAVKLQSTQDLGSCAPPITAQHTYRIGVWYKATGPIELAAYTRRPTGAYASFGSSAPFPAASQWTLAVWTTKGAPATANLALSVGVLLKQAGTYLIDDFSIADAGLAARAEIQPASVVTDSREGGGPQDLFVPSDTAPTIPAGPAAVALKANQHYGLLLSLEIVGALVVMWVLVVALDRRFKQIHRRTRTRGPAHR